MENQPTLKTKTITLIEVEDWDYLVNQVYGKPYRFQQQYGCQSKELYTFSVPDIDGEDFEETEIPFDIDGEEMGVSFETWLNTSPESTVKHFTDFNSGLVEYYNRMFWERNFYPSISMIINDLHSKGFLEEGEYSINIDW